MAETERESTQRPVVSFCLEATADEWESLYEAIKDRRGFWKSVAEENGWMEEWKDEGCHLQLWVSPDLQVLDSVDLRGDVERDLVVFRMPSIE